MKRLGGCLVVFPLLGFTGSCTKLSPPSSGLNETDDESPAPPIPEPETVIPAFDASSPQQLSCDYFPPLPLIRLQSQETIRNLTADETTYFWHSLFCDSSAADDPEGPPDCQHLIVGTSDAGFDKYRAVIKLNLADLPPAAEAENVALDLYPLSGETFFTINLAVERLDTEWWQTCPRNSADWQTLCGDELPTTTGARSTRWNQWSDDQINYWFRLDITELYRDWQNGTVANYGLMLTDANFFNKFVFASADNADPQLRPRLVITTKTAEPTLRFPLDGVYADERITGYNFGDWWEESYCADGKTPLRHTGIDLRVSPDDPVYAVSDGEIVYASLSDKWGGYVVTAHNGEWGSTCAHAIPKVVKGQLVKRGDRIAVAASGNGNFTPHLHLQIWLAPYDLRLVLIGRLPDESCRIKNSPFQPENDPSFPDKFIDPKCLNWE